MVPREYEYTSQANSVQSIALEPEREALLFPDGSMREVRLCQGQDGWYCGGAGGFQLWWEAWGLYELRYEFVARALRRTIHCIGEWPCVRDRNELVRVVKACNDHARTLLGDNPRPPREKPVPVELRCRKLRIPS